MRKLVIGAVAAASLIGGSAAIAAVNPLGIASAQNPPTTQAPTTPDSAPKGPRGDHKGPLSETLKDLVANGTITQAQADAVSNGVKDKMKDHMGGGPRGRGGFGEMKDLLDTAAGAIGIDAKTLLTERQGGKSVADVAKAHGVDPQKVIDALVAKASADLDKAVADGKISADKAATAKSKLAERFTELVNSTKQMGPGGPGGFGHGGHHPGGPGGPGTDPSTPAPSAPAAPPSTDAPTTTAPTTTAPTGTTPGTAGF